MLEPRFFLEEKKTDPQRRFSTYFQSDGSSLSDAPSTRQSGSLSNEPDVPSPASATPRNPAAQPAKDADARASIPIAPPTVATSTIRSGSTEARMNERSSARARSRAPRPSLPRRRHRPGRTTSRAVRRTTPRRRPDAPPPRATIPAAIPNSRPRREEEVERRRRARCRRRGAARRTPPSL